jgi:hypothetical protein
MVGSILGRSSIKIAHFVLIRLLTWLRQAILVSDWSISKNLLQDLPRMLPTMFRFIWQSGFRGEDFYKSANQKQEWHVVAMFVNGSGQNDHSWSSIKITHLVPIR